MSQNKQNQDGPQGTRIFRLQDVPIPDSGQSNVRLSQKGAKLIRVTDPHKGKEYTLHPGRTTLGRNKDNDVVLDEPTVSAVHARIVNEKSEWRVINLLSSNGTFVNGRKITQHPLRHGDRIRFGEVAFYFEAAAHRKSVRILFWLALGLSVSAAAAYFII